MSSLEISNAKSENIADFHERFESIVRSEDEIISMSSTALNDLVNQLNLLFVDMQQYAELNRNSPLDNMFKLMENVKKAFFFSREALNLILKLEKNFYMAEVEPHLELSNLMEVIFTKNDKETLEKHSSNATFPANSSTNFAQNRMRQRSRSNISGSSRLLENDRQIFITDNTNTTVSRTRMRSISAASQYSLGGFTSNNLDAIQSEASTGLISETAFPHLIRDLAEFKPSTTINKPAQIQSGNVSEADDLSSMISLAYSRSFTWNDQALKLRRMARLSEHIRARMTGSVGLCSTMDISAGTISIGLSRGSIFCFDLLQRLTKHLTPDEELQWGSVTALEASNDGKFLVAGYSSGIIVTWELKSEKPYYILAPQQSKDSIMESNNRTGHRDRCAIKSVSITRFGNFLEFISIDESGILCHHTIRAIVGIPTCDSKILLSSSQKNISLEAQAPDFEGKYDHWCYRKGLFFVLYGSTLFIYKSSPKPTLLKKFEISLPESFEINLNGNLALKIHSSEIIACCITINNFICCLSVSITGGQVQVDECSKFELSSQVYFLGFIDKYTAFSVDSNDIARFISWPETTEIESMSIKKIPLNLNAYLGDSMEITGSYNGSIICHKGRIFFLTSENVWIGFPRNWEDRLRIIQSNDGTLVMAKFAADILLMKPKIYIADRESLSEKEGGKLQNYLFESLHDFLDLKIPDIFHAKVEENEEFNELFNSFFEICQKLKAYDWFADYFLARLPQKYRLQSLQCICENILSSSSIENNQTLSLGATLQNDLVEYQSRKLEEDFSGRNVNEFSNLVLKLDIQELNIDNCIRIADQFSADTLWAYLVSQGLLDFVSPLIRYLNRLKMSKGNPKYSQELFKYLSLSIEGYSYPKSDLLSPDNSIKAKKDLTNVILSPKFRSEVPRIFSFAADLSYTDSQYPYLAIMLVGNLNLSLDFFSKALTQREFESGLEIPVDMSSKNSETIFINRKMVMDTLISVFSVIETTYDESKLLLFYAWVAEEFRKYPKDIDLSVDICCKILFYLVEYTTIKKCYHHRIEQAILYLVSLVELTIEEEKFIIDNSEKSGFWKVVEFLFKKQRDFESTLRCWIEIETEEQSGNIWSNLREAFSQKSALNLGEKENLKEAFMHKFCREIFNIDASKATRLALDYFPSSLKLITDKLKLKTKAFYEYFTFLLSLDRSELTSEQLTEVEDIIQNEELVQDFLRLICDIDESELLNLLHKHNFNAEPKYLFKTFYEKNCIRALMLLYEQKEPETAISKSLDLFAEKANHILQSEILSDDSNTLSNIEYFLLVSDFIINSVIRYSEKTHHDVQKIEDYWCTLFEIMIKIFIRVKEVKFENAAASIIQLKFTHKMNLLISQMVFFVNDIKFMFEKLPATAMLGGSKKLNLQDILDTIFVTRNEKLKFYSIFDSILLKEKYSALKTGITKRKKCRQI